MTDNHQGCIAFVRVLALIANARRDKCAYLQEIKYVMCLGKPCGACLDRLVPLVSKTSNRIYLMHLEELITWIDQHADQDNTEDMFGGMQ